MNWALFSLLSSRPYWGRRRFLVCSKMIGKFKFLFRKIRSVIFTKYYTIFVFSHINKIFIKMKSNGNAMAFLQIHKITFIMHRNHHTHIDEIYFLLPIFIAPIFHPPNWNTKLSLDLLDKKYLLHFYLLHTKQSR